MFRLALLVLPLLLAAPAMATPITSYADPALAGGISVDFEGLPQGEYTSLEIGRATFTADLATPLVVCAGCGGFGGAFGDVGQSLNTLFGGSFTITFVESVTAFALTGGGYNSDWSISAYDVADQLIESITVSHSETLASYVDGIRAPGIRKVVFNNPDNDFVVFDNLLYVSVPEPGSLALLGAGLVALGIRRKQSKTLLF